MADKELKIGLLLDSPKVPSWFYRMVEEVNQIPQVSVNLIVLNGRREHKGGSKLSNLYANRKHLLYALYSAVDSKVFSGKVNDSFRSRNIQELLPNAAVETVVPEGTLLADKFTEADLDKLKGYQCDIMIRGGFRILRGGILKLPRLGIWSYHHGDNRINRGGPAAFWEVFEKHDTTGAILQVLSEDLDNGVILDRIWCGTDHLSVTRNRENLYGKASHLLPRQISLLMRKGEEEYMKGVAQKQEPVNFYSSRLYMKPGNGKMFNLLFSHARKIIAQKLSGLFTEDHWHVLVSYVKSDYSASMFRFRKLPNPKGTFWADPFVCVKDGKAYIFLEEYIYKTDKGHISVAVTDLKGKLLEHGKVIETPYHLSYPFIFEKDGKMFMIPETATNNSIDCYECEEFPYKWKFKSSLMSDVTAVDTTLFEHNGKWWMFTCLKKRNGVSTNDELNIFFASDPFGTWSSHAMNPINSDIRKARPSGKVFTKNGQLYRPTQDGSKRYGYASRFFRIDELNENNYRETEVAEILPLWDKQLLSTHTFNFDAGVTVIDGKYRSSRWFNKN